MPDLPRTSLAGLPAEAAEVARLLEKGNTKSAVDAAKAVHARLKTAASEALLVDAYCARIRSMLDHHLTAEANALAAMVHQRYPSSAHRLRTVDSARAAAGLDDILRPLANPSVSSDEQAKADSWIRANITDPAQLADSQVLDPSHPLRRAAVAVKQALAVVTAGPVTDEQLALPEVSRRSPLAPWKPLIRAIACYYRRDDQGCLEQLSAIDPDSAPARLVPVLQVMAGQGDERKLAGAAASALLKQVRGDLSELRRALDSAEKAFNDHSSKAFLNTLRQAFLLIQHNAPDIMPEFKRQVAARALLMDVPYEKVHAAVGGIPAADARSQLILARLIEQDVGTPLMSCLAWEQFRLSAIKAGWFTSRSPEAAVLYLHMAKRAAAIGPGEREEEYHQMQQMYRREMGSGIDTPTLPFLYPQWLYEQACDIDPRGEAFEQWAAWARSQKQPPDAEQQALNAWRKALPNDVRPLLRMIDAAEDRQTFKKALDLLKEAERLDGVNAEVRKARLRLLLRSLIRHIQKRQYRLGQERLAELEALPQARENDRAAFVLAMRIVLESEDFDPAAPTPRTEQLAQMLGSPAAALMAIEGAAVLCGRYTEVINKIGKTWIVPLCRVYALFQDLDFDLRILTSWWWQVERELRNAPPTDPFLLDRLGHMALRHGHPLIAFQITVRGFKAGPEHEPRFLLLRALTLMKVDSYRSEDCFGVAAILAREANDTVLTNKVLQAWNQQSVGGILGIPLPEIDDKEMSKILKRERTAKRMPDKRPYFDDPGALFDDRFLAPPTQRRRGRRRQPRDYDPFDDVPF